MDEKESIKIIKRFWNGVILGIVLLIALITYLIIFPGRYQDLSFTHKAILIALLTSIIIYLILFIRFFLNEKNIKVMKHDLYKKKKV